MKKKVQKIEKKKKKNPYFEEIMKGLNDALEFERGNKTLRTSGVRVAPVKKVNAREILKLRERLSLSQADLKALN